MCKLHQLGGKGLLWTLIDDCHTDTFCSVAVNQKNSDWFPISQGVEAKGSTFNINLLGFHKRSLTRTTKPNLKYWNPQHLQTQHLQMTFPLQPYHHEVFKPAYDFSTRWQFNINASESYVLYFSPTGVNNNSLAWKLDQDTNKNFKII